MNVAEPSIVVVRQGERLARPRVDMVPVYDQLLFPSQCAFSFRRGASRPVPVNVQQFSLGRAGVLA